MRWKAATRAFVQVQAWALAISLASALVISARAQGFPSGPVTIIVPYAPGGATDNLARLVANQLSKVWGKPVLVENKTGANGIIGAGVVANAKPDGQTLLLVVPGHLINPTLFANSPYDVLKDFTPITQVGSSPWLVVGNNQVAASNLKELIALAKAEPGKLAFGSSEPSTWLAGKLFEQLAGVELLSVPYKGASTVVTDLLGNSIQLMFTTPLSVSSYLSSGKLRAFAVASSARMASLPDIPTADEAGLRGYESGAWYGLYGPARMPQTVTKKIQQAVAQVLSQPQTRERLVAMGAAAVGSSPQTFAEFTASEFSKYKMLIKDAKIEPQ
jgi:tripartite-type tricarboxylate transporter receptor subunit TctC